MSATIEMSVVEHIRGVVGGVFKTMVNTPAKPTTDIAPLPPERTSGTIGIAGDINGAIYLHLPDALARSVTGIILQLPQGEQATDTDIKDALGELTNMVGGGLKSHLNNQGIDCCMSTPSIIRGVFDVDAGPEQTTEKIFFNCLGQRFAVEVHLKHS